MDKGKPKLGVCDRVLVGIAGALGPVVIRLLGSTWRVVQANAERLEGVRAAEGGVVFAFWHGQLLALEFVHRGEGIQVLSSWHRDGEISARLMTSLGYGVVRGSSTRGSARGLMLMLRRAKEGHDLAVTPDGPRGPARTVKRGTFYLSEKSGSLIVPVGVGTSRAFRLGSWDSFMIPHPFARVGIVYGRPFAPDPGVSFEEKARHLAERLDALSLAAEDLACGRSGRGLNRETSL
jgi:lysophospholipid acyltransferase (LPLAT)-like uncharacterized protein